jgi:hypothetical protein
MFIALGPSNDLFGKLTSADATRGDARRDRLAQAKPTVPTVVSGFMLLLVGPHRRGAGLLEPRADHGPQIVTLVIVIILTGGALLLIRGLDRHSAASWPSSRPNITAEQVTKDYMASYPASPLPCDDQGNPTAPPQQSTPTTTTTAPTPTTTTVTTTTTITS